MPTIIEAAFPAATVSPTESTIHEGGAACSR